MKLKRSLDIDKKENAPLPTSQNKEKQLLPLKAGLPTVPKLQHKAKQSKENARALAPNYNKPDTKVAASKKSSKSSLDPTTMYLNEIGHTPLLSANKEVRLAER